MTSFKFLVMVALVAVAKPAMALQLDWNGQFWFDQNWLNNYQLDRSRPGYDNDPNFVNAGGPYVPGVGEKNVVWYSTFLKLKPKVIVNDSINIRSEWHVGSPIYGFWGRQWPSGGDERYNFTGTAADGLDIKAARAWVNLITDFGTVELGRAPIHWGLGAIWNSGDELFDRYQNTGDMLRLTAKFGNFMLQPALVKVVGGNNVGGALTPVPANTTPIFDTAISTGNPVVQTVQGNDDVTDYNLAVKYDNTEEDFEFGMMWTKRSGNAAQKSIYFNKQERGSTRINYNLFDFFARKKLGRFRLAGELPLFNGSIGALDTNNEFDYKAIGFVFEGGYSSDIWDIALKAGHIPGQPPTSVGDNKFRAMYLNKNYDLGLIMFHYNVYGLGQNNPSTFQGGALKSPYDSAIVNANYVALTPEAKFDKWSFRTAFVLGYAVETAQAGRQFYNYESRSFATAIANQSSFLGWEADLGTSFRWDENSIISWDFGLWFPGAYYEFSNLPDPAFLKSDMMFASQVKVGVTF